MSSGQKKFPDHTISLQFCKNNTKSAAIRHMSRPEKNAAKSGGLLSPFEHHKTPPQANGKNLLRGMAGRQNFPSQHRLEEDRKKRQPRPLRTFCLWKRQGTRRRPSAARLFYVQRQAVGFETRSVSNEKSFNADVATRQGPAAGEERPFAPLYRRCPEKRRPLPPFEDGRQGAQG